MLADDAWMDVGQQRWWPDNRSRLTYHFTEKAIQTANPVDLSPTVTAFSAAWIAIDCLLPVLVGVRVSPAIAILRALTSRFSWQVFPVMLRRICCSQIVYRFVI